MNIWFINQYAIPPSQAGITRHYDFAKGLIERGHRVTVIASSFDHVTRKETRLEPHEEYRLEENLDVPFLWLRTPAYDGNGLPRIKNMLSFAWQVARSKATQELHKPDVVVGSSPHLFGALAAYLLAKKYKCRFVLEVRDLWPESLVELGSFSRNHPVVKGLEVLERFLYRRASTIVSLLPYAVEHIVQKGVDRSKVVWIPNGVSLDRIPEAQLANPQPPFKALYAGTHGLANSLHTLLEAAQILKNQNQQHIQIQFLGDGPEKPRLQEMAARLQLENVSFEPTIRKTEVYQRLQQADAFILPLLDSPLFKYGISANKLFDYLACKKPIVFAVNAPNNPVAECNAGITVPPGNPEAMAKALIDLANISAEERHQMGERGHRYVVENYDLRNLIQRYESTLQPNATANALGARVESK